MLTYPADWPQPVQIGADIPPLGNASKKKKFLSELEENGWRTKNLHLNGGKYEAGGLKSRSHVLKMAGWNWD